MDATAIVTITASFLLLRCSCGSDCSLFDIPVTSAGVVSSFGLSVANGSDFTSLSAGVGAASLSVDVSVASIIESSVCAGASATTGSTTI